MIPDIRKIICAVDFSEFSKRIISFGAFVSSRLDAEMIVYHTICDDVNPLFGTAENKSGDIRKKAIQRAMGKISEMAGSHSVSWRPAVSFGDPVEEILKQVRVEAADMVMAASYGLSGMQRLLSGTLVERLARSLPCPFLVVHPKPGRPKPSREIPRAIRNVIVGCDPRIEFSMALSYGQYFSSLFDAHLKVFHAVEKPFDDDQDDPAPGPYEAMQKAYMDRIETEIREKVGASGVDPSRMSVHVTPGHPGDEIVKGVHDSDEDLIIVGVRQRGLLSKLFIGSTVEAVLRRAAGPVLIIPKTAQSVESA